MFSHREAAKCKDLTIHEQNRGVVTARSHLDTWTWKSLRQSRRAPEDRNVDVSEGCGENYELFNKCGFSSSNKNVQLFMV